MSRYNKRFGRASVDRDSCCALRLILSRLSTASRLYILVRLRLRVSFACLALGSLHFSRLQISDTDLILDASPPAILHMHHTSWLFGFNRFTCPFTAIKDGRSLRSLTSPESSITNVTREDQFLNRASAIHQMRSRFHQILFSCQYCQRKTIYLD